MAADPRRVKELFVAALDLPDAQARHAFLENACGGDADLRHRLDVLLRAHADPASALNQPLAEIAPPDRGTAGDGSSSTPPPTVAPPSRPEAVGAVLAGRYKLLEAIGEGGMGAVWVAQQTEPVKRLVAVKLIKAGMDSKQVLARFEAERQALALMDHPHIARVLDAGATPDGRPFFVMELVKGVPITRYCDEHHLTPRQRLELFVPVCHALQHAHQKGIIHRDLKPSNVLVARYDDKPVPKVIDFGVAKAAGQQLTEQTLHTGFGAVVGTVEYMSPEQASFNQLDVDTRSDIYSLGVLLYELLAGSPPFTRKQLEQAGMLEMLRVIREQEPSKPSTRLSTADGLPTLAVNRGTEPKKLTALVRGELDWIVMKALEKARNRRYETANGLAMDVQRYLADEPVQACPPSVGYRLRKFVRRNKVVLTTAALVALALVLGTVASTWMAVLARERFVAEKDARQDADVARRQAEEDRDRARKAEGEVQHQLYRAKLAQSKADRGNEGLGQRSQSLKALAEAATMVPALNLDSAAVLDLRNEVIGKLTLADLRLTQQWEGPAEGAAVAFDPRLERYARASGKGTVSVRQVEGDRELVELPAPAGTDRAVASLLFSPDGRFLAAVYSSPQGADNARHLGVWELSSRKAVLGASEAQGGLAFSPDSRQLAFGHPDRSIRLHELPSGRERKRLSPELAPALLQFHPAGDRLAVGNLGSKAVHLVSLETGQVTFKLAHEEGVTALAWHPGGNFLATASPGSITLWDTEVAPEKLVVWIGSALSLLPQLSFSHSGDMLAAPGQLFDPWVGQFLVGPSAATGIWPQFSPDDGRLAYRQGARLGVLQVVASREWRTLRRYRELLRGGRGIDCSPDGRLLVSAGADGARFWDLAAGVEVPSLRIPGAAAVFDQATGDVLTSGPTGLYRWPVVRGGDPGPDGLRVGPPHALLSVNDLLGPVALTADGRSLVVKAAADEAVVFHADRPGQPVRLKGHPGLAYVAVSPDGRWAATAPWKTRWVCLWDARSGRLVRHLPGSEAVARATVAFSPDGRWLVTGTDKEFRFWQVETGEPGFRIAKDAGAPLPGQLAFSRDGTLLALQDSWARVKLIDPRTGAELATLATSDDLGMPAPSMCFSPDGGQLIVGDERNQVHVWDVRLTRARLAEMRLDWDLPPYPPPTVLAAEGRLHGTVVLDASEIRSFHGHSTADPNGVAFSPDGRYGLSSSPSGALRLWDLETGKEKRRFVGHTAQVCCVAISPDGRRALSGSHDQTVRLWDVDTGKELRQFKGHTNSVYGVTFSPDGRHALTGAGRPDSTLRLWDVESGAELRRFLGHTDGLWSIALSPDGRHALSGSDNSEHTIRLWDVGTGKGVWRFEGHSSAVRCVAFSPDGRRAISAGHDQTLRLWDLKTGQELRRFDGHTAPVLSVALSPDGRYALSGGWDRTARLWDVETGLELWRWQAHGGQGVHRVAFSPDGRRALSVGGDGALRLWDLTARQREGPDFPKYAQAVDRNPEDAAAHHQLAWALATASDPIHRDVKRAVEQARKAVGLAPQEGRFWTTLGVALHRTGDWGAAVEALDRSVQLRKEADGASCFFLAMAHWRLGHDEQARAWGRRALRYAGGHEPNEELRRFSAEAAAMLPEVAQIRRLEGHTGAVSAVAYSPDGRHALSASADDTLRLWDLETGKEKRRFVGHTGAVWCVAFAPDGRRAASGGTDHIVRVWDVDTGKELRQLKGHLNDVWGVAFSPDGRHVLSGSGAPDNTLRLWDVDSGKEVRQFTGHTSGIWSVAFSPDGRYALSGANSPENAARLWDVETGKENLRFRGHGDAVHCVAFSRDGRRVLTGSNDTTVRLWDVKTGRELRRFKGHGNRVYKATFSPEGRSILSASADATVRLWDVEAGKEIRRFLGHQGEVNCVTFSPDGRQALSAGDDKTLRLWELPPAGAKAPPEKK